MKMSTSDFAVEYHRLTDDELLQISSEGGLVAEAKSALQAELSSRKLSSHSLDTYKEDQLRNQRVRLEQSNESGCFRLYGRKILSDGDTSQSTEIRTKWFALRSVPIFPIASYRYSRRQRTLGKASLTEEKLIEQVPLNWGQVLQTAAITYGLILLTLVLIVVIGEWQIKTHGR